MTETVDIVTLLSGRFATWPHYLGSLRGLDFPRDRLRVFWYTNSPDPEFHREALAECRRLNAEGLAVRLTVDPTLPLSGIALREMRKGEPFPRDQCEVIAELYNRATAPTGHDLFLLEDDCGAPPGVLGRLRAIARATGAGLVFSLVRCRHGDMPWVWDLRRDGDRWALVPPAGGLAPGVRPAGVGGFVCSYLPRWALRQLAQPAFKPYAPAEWGQHCPPACDMVLCVEMERLGIPRACDFGLRPAHYDSRGVAH